ncbi:MAG: AAA family ATPase [Actinomycetaceae bacterium]|nr:AAA family ATPase [Actinomycetaceae bacterium]
MVSMDDVTAPLGRLSVKGYASIDQVDLELTSAVTVLIGANGAGKSSLVSALEVISRIWDNSFQEYLGRHGGLPALLHADAEGSSNTATFEIRGRPDERKHSNGYRVRLQVDRNSEEEAVLVAEDFLFHDHNNYVEPYREQVSRWVTRSRAASFLATEDPEDGKLQRFARYVAPLVSGCRVFHFDDVSPKAPARSFSDVGDDVALRANAENIAAYLLRIRDDYPRHYRRIVAAVRLAAPFFEDFVLQPNSNDRLRLRWRQRGLDRVFQPHSLSDGTLRFICLATLLLGPDLPATIVLDEPELGLHPAAIGLLAEMVHAAADEGHRILLATQSVPLLSHFSLEEVAVLNREGGSTTVSRPDPEELAGFLEDYSVGSLWEMNLLRGRPSPEAPDRETE